MAGAIGIDLGTYNSAAAYAVDEHQIHMIGSNQGPTQQGQVFPSFIRFDANGEPNEFGERARLQMATVPDLVVWGAKRLIGRPFAQVGDEACRFAYAINPHADGSVVIHVGPRAYSPLEIAARILRWMKDSAQNRQLNPFLTEPIRKAVITHPAYFEPTQIEQTKQAAKLPESAGGPAFDEVELIAEPVAAALAYGVQLDPHQPQCIMAIDWGAGTLDIAVVLLRLGQDGMPEVAEVKPARGDIALGGIDMDDKLICRAVNLYGFDALKPLLPSNEKGREVRLPRLAAQDIENWREMSALRDKIEQTKIDLSNVPATKAFVTYRGKPFQIKMARSKGDRLDRGDDWILLNEVLAPLLKEFRTHIEFTLKKSGLGPEHIQHVLLIGGPMYLACVREQVKSVFARNRAVLQELQRIDEQGFPVDPMQAVARGAGLFACGIGPHLGAKRIPRDYGVLLGCQGDVLIHDGDPVDHEYPLRTPLTCHGQPGQQVPVGLFMREETSSKGELFTRLGEYSFVGVFGDDGATHFLPTLKVEPDKTVSLSIKDMDSGDQLTLPRLDKLTGEKMGRPSPFGKDTPTGGAGGGNGGCGGWVPPRAPGDVPADLVSVARARAQALIRIAQMKRLQIQGNTALPSELDERIGKVEEVLSSVTDGRPANQSVYQKLHNRTTELESFLDTSGLVTEAERRLLR